MDANLRFTSVDVLVYFGLLLGGIQGVLGKGKFVVDRSSCGTSFGNVREATEEAVRMADQAAKELAKGSQRNEAVTDGLAMILPDEDSITYVQERLKRTATFRYKGDSFLAPKGLDREDLVITCNGKHVFKRKLKDDFDELLKRKPKMSKSTKKAQKKKLKAAIKAKPYRNRITQENLSKDDDEVLMKQGHADLESAEAVTTYDEKETKYPGSMYLNQKHIADLRKQGFPELNQEKIDEAIDEDEDTPADAVRFRILSHTILHELQHLPLPGEPVAEDIATTKGFMYTWDECVEGKDKNNAETIALVALLVELILKHSHEITEDGSIVPIGDSGSDEDEDIEEDSGSD